MLAVLVFSRIYGKAFGFQVQTTRMFYLQANGVQEFARREIEDARECSAHA
jgi:hypothetical protein